MNDIVYCSCKSIRKGILKRLPYSPLKPDGQKRIMPSFICPDCCLHRKLMDHYGRIDN